MNRGTVMEIGGNTAIILTPDGEFVHVRTRGRTRVGAEVTWTETDRVGNKRNGAVSNARRWIFSGVSAAVLLTLCVALWSLRVPPVVAYVAMDVNPSVEFGLDAKERVRELRALNDDALPMIDGVAYKGQPVAEIAQAIAAKLAAAHILSTDGEVVIASVRLRDVDEQWEAQVTEKIRQALQQATGEADPAAQAPAAGLKIETLYLPVEVRNEAVENGISSGKMAYWLAAENSGREVQMDDLRTESVRENAAPAGGLKQVLEESKIKKEDKDSWKKLLNEKKEKLLKQKEDRKKNGVPSPADEPSSSPDDRPNPSAHPDDGDGGKEEGDKEEIRNEDPDKNKGRSPDQNENKDKNKGKDRNEDKEENMGKGKDQDDGLPSASPAGKGDRDEDDREKDSGVRGGGNNGGKERDQNQDRGEEKNGSKKGYKDREADRGKDRDDRDDRD